MSVASGDYDSSSQLKVYIRMRPMRADSTKRATHVIEKGVALNYKEKIHQLYFDGVFDEDAKQNKVFAETCKPILDNVLEGCSGSLFVYGQTGTGKTYTMGTLETIKREDQGMIPLSLKYLFESLADKQGWTISLSFLQIYKEDIFDLLNDPTKKLQIREDLETQETYVDKLTLVPLSNYMQSIELINQGLEERKTGPQKMNQLSSRSHTIVSINVVQRLNNTQYLTSNFSLVDLAGSERVKKSNSTGVRLDEAKFINSSLSALGNVISGLAENDSQKYIPYRSSKLTRILKNSLSGKSRVGVICTLESSEENLHETYSTLLFADRCKAIRFLNQPIINIEDFEELGMEKSNKDELDRLRMKEKEYVQTIKSLKEGSLKGETQRELQLTQIIEMIFRIFGEMNSHLKKSVQGDNSVVESQKPKPVQGTSIKQLKQTVRGLAQETIDQINTLTTMASGGKGHKINSQSQTLCSIIFELVRSNLKTYEFQLKEQRKEPLEKEFMAKEYQKQLKQGIINKLKAKKLKIVSSFQQIWAESDSIAQNPLQSLLNNFRKGQLTSTEVAKPSQQTSIKQSTSTPNNPKDILKRITKQESERKQKQLSEKKEAGEEEKPGREEETPRKQIGENSPGIKYFQKSSAKSRVFQQTPGGGGEGGSTNLEIKKILDNLIIQKNNHQQRKNLF